MKATEIQDLPVGAKVRVTFEATVVEKEEPRSMTAPRLYAPSNTRTVKALEIRPAMQTAYGRMHPLMLTRAQASAAKEIERVLPKWQPGDVVVVRYDGPNSTPYTYVRGATTWPGEYGATVTDSKMARLFDEGKATLAMRDGKPYVEGSVLPF